MKHSGRETFFWFDAACLLDRVHISVPLPASEANAQKDFSRVVQRLALATTILISLARREISIDELDRHENASSEMRIGPLPVNIKKYCLAFIGATGTTNDRIVKYALQSGHITAQDVLRAKRKRKRRPEYDAERIGIVARFLVDFWCGRKRFCHQPRRDGVFYMPPLCFFSNGALATFCAICLGMAQSDKETTAAAVRKWISRLRLVRPLHATAPRIVDVKEYPDGICFSR